VGEMLLVNKFFPIVDTCLTVEDIARQICVMVRRWRFLAIFASCILASHVQHVSAVHPKFALRPHHLCGSMVDIQSATAEIRR